MKHFNKNQRDEFLPAGFDPHQSLQILTEYLKSLEKAYDDLKKTSYTDFRNLELENRTFKKENEDLNQEIERLTTDLLQLTNMLEDQDITLLNAKQKSYEYEKQAKSLQRNNVNLESLFAKKESDHKFYVGETERLTSEHKQLINNTTSLNKRNEELERSLSSEKSSNLGLEKENRKLVLHLSESQEKIKLVETKLRDRLHTQEAEILKINERIKTESQHEVNILKKRVFSSVTAEIHEYDILFNDKLSIELAGNLRAMVTRLLAKLEQAGLKLRE